MMLVGVLEVLFNNDTAYFEALLKKAAPVTDYSYNGIKASLEYQYNHFIAELIINKGKLQALIIFSCFIFGMALLKNTFIYLAIVFVSKTVHKTVRDVRTGLYDKLVELHIGYFSNEKKGNILGKFTSDMKEVELGVLGAVGSILRDPLQILIYFITMISISGELTLFVLFFLPVSGGIIALVGSSLRKVNQKGQERFGDMLSHTESSISGLQIIKGYNAEGYMRKQFLSFNDSYTKLMIKLFRKTDLASPVSELLGTFTVLVTAIYGGYLVFGGHLEASLFILYIILFSQIINPFKSLTRAMYVSKKALSSLDRINEIIDTKSDIQDSVHPKTPDFKSKISFNNISFKYNEALVLKNVSLEIPKGKSVALVGQSGSGKSTIAKLLPRFYDTVEGDILIDGTSIKEFRKHDLRAMMGIVTQDSILFNDSVLNNIAFGLDNVNKEQVVEAAKIANAHEFISQLENGYDTNIGDGGGKLSGGQKQRISIARAVLKNPDILVLDEATSALDTESEKLVQEALNHLMKNRTSLIIAHRLSTIQHVDEIIVMQEGQILERGTHHELLERNGAYKKLIDMQSFG